MADSFTVTLLLFLAAGALLAALCMTIDHFDRKD